MNRYRIILIIFFVVIDFYQGKPACNYPGLTHGLRLISEVKFFYEINETIKFECFEGTMLRGNAIIKCIASGRWNGPIPDCIPNGGEQINSDSFDIF